ncbi:MAG: hypothetical protein JRJ42_08570 [Deltaproteobacteria bacterium]|nr:hypothetical protein [Deltaproteobacteria bacterium]MBW2020635.1 hypothetical protein [Deltaproteobacteria bacterium]
MNRNMQIGFSQRVRLEWLEQTAQLFLAGNSKKQIEMALQETLRDRLSVGGRAKRGNREKAITILLKVWVNVPRGMEAFRDDGLELIKELPNSSHLPIHWGMSMSVYPFFGLVAETAGRLFKLQGTASASQVQRRIREQLGERETVARAARRVLRCFTDWGVLRDTDKKGVYVAAPQHTVKNGKLLSWLIEAALISNGSNALPLRSISSNPAFFPFSIGMLNLAQLETNPRLSFFRHGLDEDMVSLGSDEL